MPAYQELKLPGASVPQHVQTAVEQEHEAPKFCCSIAAIAVPAVAFGAATLLQQAQQANEDRALRLKAIHKHNTFLSTQEEDDELADTAAATSSVTNTAMQSSGSPSQSNTSSSDEPDTAAPAMLDQPDRPEPRLPSLDEEAGSSLTPDADKQTNLPPQTAMLDRPERPEPESSHRDAADTQSSFTEQSGDVILGHDQFARPSSPANKEEVPCAHQDCDHMCPTSSHNSALLLWHAYLLWLLHVQPVADAPFRY